MRKLAIFLIAVFALGLFELPAIPKAHATAAQSMQVTVNNPSATLPNSAPYNTIGGGNSRWEMRLHNFPWL
jgi:hypothetical protein